MDVMEKKAFAFIGNRLPKIPADLLRRLNNPSMT